MIRTKAWLSRYLDDLSNLTANASATLPDGASVGTDVAMDWAVQKLFNTRAAGGKIMFVGNGGSAAIASHMAVDYSKNGNFPALAFNDAASLTCLANDLGFENVFAHHIEALGRHEDLLVAISSSGRSSSILNAVSAARVKETAVLTLSGFDIDNPLRSLGDMNLYVESSSYGFVEIGHLTLCHALLDFAMEWRPETQ
jgi:D-sedoheptulose 7-phosphate isomerase